MTILDVRRDTPCPLCVANFRVGAVMHKIASEITELDEPVLRRWPGWTSLVMAIAFQCTLAFGPIHPMQRGELNYLVIGIWIAIACAGAGLSLGAIVACRAIAKLAAYVGFTLFAMVAVVLAKYLLM
jgi:hypothetical protein